MFGRVDVPGGQSLLKISCIPFNALGTEPLPTGIARGIDPLETGIALGIDPLPLADEDLPPTQQVYAPGHNFVVIFPPLQLIVQDPPIAEHFGPATLCGADPAPARQQVEEPGQRPVFTLPAHAFVQAPPNAVHLAPGTARTGAVHPLSLNTFPSSRLRFLYLLSSFNKSR